MIINPKLNSTQLRIVNSVASELQTITQAIEGIEIVVRGGFIPDLLLKTEARDIDLFYCITDKSGNYSQECCCDEIRKQIDKLNLDYIGRKYEYDLENSFEKEPRLRPIERTVGFFSYHTDWFSMFCIDKDGKIWTNRRTYDYFNKRTFDLRYEGSLPWAYYPKSTDSNNYYVSFVCQMIRDLSHIYRRKLKIGENFQELLDNMPFILSKALEVEQSKRAANYFRKKFKSLEEFKTALKELKIENRKEILQGIISIGEKHKNH